MTKHQRRLPEADLLLIEADLQALDTEYNKIEDHDDPAFEDQIDGLFDRMATLEKRALSRPPKTLQALAIQSRIASRMLIGSSVMNQLIVNIQALAAAPPPKPGIRLRHGKRYRKRNGKVTGRLEQIDSKGFIFADEPNCEMFEADGRHIGCDRMMDLVEEIVPAPRAAKRTVAPSAQVAEERAAA